MQRRVIKGDTEIRTGFDERLAPKLFFHIGHVRNRQIEKDHQLLNFPGSMESSSL